MQQSSSVPGATLAPASMRTGLERASQAVLNQQWSIALSYLSEEGPVTTFPEYYALKALVLQQSQQWRPALALYEQLLLIEPSQPVWNLSAGIASQQLGFLESSQQYFKRASQQQNKLPLTSQQFLARQLASNN